MRVGLVSEQLPGAVAASTHLQVLEGQGDRLGEGRGPPGCHRSTHYLGVQVQGILLVRLFKKGRIEDVSQRSVGDKSHCAGT